MFPLPNPPPPPCCFSIYCCNYNRCCWILLVIIRRITAAVISTVWHLADWGESAHSHCATRPSVECSQDRNDQIISTVLYSSHISIVVLLWLLFAYAFCCCFWSFLFLLLCPLDFSFCWFVCFKVDPKSQRTVCCISGLFCFFVFFLLRFLFCALPEYFSCFLPFYLKSFYLSDIRLILQLSR